MSPGKRWMVADKNASTSTSRHLGCHVRRRAAGSRSATCRATVSTPGRAYRSRERTEIEAQFTALRYFAPDGTDHASGNRLRIGTWTNDHRRQRGAGKLCWWLSK